MSFESPEWHATKVLGPAARPRHAADVGVPR